MVSQAVLIGIAVGVFFAGLGVGYAAFQSYNQPNFAMMTPQQMQQMMNNPQMMTQWQQNMMNNPQVMNSWMNTMMQSPQFGQWMMGSMMQNPQMMNPWMGNMMNDPQLREQMYSQMMQNNQFMQGMMGNQQFQNQWMMQNGSTGGGMMGSPMMGQGMMMDPGMMQGSIPSVSQSLPTGEAAQTRTFEIFLDEVKIFAETENENGEEEIVEVELHLWNPSNIVVNKGDTVVLKVSNPRGSIHSLAIPQFGVSTGNLEPRGGTETMEFVADKAGVFTFICNTPYVPEQNWCSADHAAMIGTIIVLE